MSVVNIKKKNLQSLGYEDVKDWIADPNNVYIGRPNYYLSLQGLRGSKWANPFPISETLSREQSIKKYRAWLKTSGLSPKELKGKNLGCWCSPEPCHGDVLLELANSN